MRQIKFRAWDKQEKVMHPHVEDWYDTLSEKEGEPPQTEQSFGEVLSSPKRYEVMQYTGLKDKNGKEIYEGDILRHRWDPDDTKDETIFVVEWTSLSDCCVRGEGFSFGLQEEHAPRDPEDCEVIGNIHETPQLVNNL